MPGTNPGSADGLRVPENPDEIPGELLCRVALSLLADGENELAKKFLEVACDRLASERAFLRTAVERLENDRPDLFDNYPEKWVTP